MSRPQEPYRAELRSMPPFSAPRTVIRFRMGCTVPLSARHQCSAQRQRAARRQRAGTAFASPALAKASPQLALACRIHVLKKSLPHSACGWTPACRSPAPPATLMELHADSCSSRTTPRRSHGVTGHACPVQGSFSVLLIWIVHVRLGRVQTAPAIGDKGSGPPQAQADDSPITACAALSRTSNQNKGIPPTIDCPFRSCRDLNHAQPCRRRPDP